MERRHTRDTLHARRANKAGIVTRMQRDAQAPPSRALGTQNTGSNQGSRTKHEPVHKHQKQVWHAHVLTRNLGFEDADRIND